MIDTQKQVDYWRTGAAEEWEVASDLLDRGRVRHGLFFLHLTMEKVLKAHVARVSGEVPPRTHNLLRLSDLAKLELSRDDATLLVELNQHCIEARYPESYAELPAASELTPIRAKTERLYQWLRDQL